MTDAFLRTPTRRQNGTSNQHAKLSVADLYGVRLEFSPRLHGAAQKQLVSDASTQTDAHTLTH